MKRKWSAVILGLIALTGLCLWHGRAPTQSPVQDAAPDVSTETLLTIRPRSLMQSAKSEPMETERLLDRLAADVTIVQADPDSIRQSENLQMLVDSISFSEIQAVLQFLQRQEQTQMLQDLQVLLVRKGASTDPKTAASWAEQMPAGSTRFAAIAGVGVVWANQNLADAARWALELAEGEDRENGLGHVAYEAARTRPSFALELSANLAPNDARDELVRHAARQWAAQEPTDAVAWARELTNPTLREEVLADIAAAWGETDPTSAATLAVQSLSVGRLQEDALVGIAQHWVQKEPERAASWVFEFPDSLQPTALENVVKLWADSDAVQAQKWAESLPRGSQRDAALNVLAAK